MIGYGEYLLLSEAPMFKRRYAVDGDVILGCTIGCQFCYYRMIDATAPYIGTGRLRSLATPEEFAESVAGSKLVSERSLVIMGARGDASMYPSEIPKVLDAAEKLDVKAKFLALRRAAYDKTVREHLASYTQLYYGTTITPRAAETGTPVQEGLQLRGLRHVADFSEELRKALSNPEAVEAFHLYYDLDIAAEAESPYSYYIKRARKLLDKT